MGNCLSQNQGSPSSEGAQLIPSDSLATKGGEENVAGSSPKKTVVLVCGGGNAAHVLATVLGSKPEFEVRVLTMYADEAARWSAKLKENDGKMKVYLKEEDMWVEGSPAVVAKEAKDVVPGAEWAILALPSTLHELYLKLIAKHSTPGAPIKIGALSPHGGFDLGVRDDMKGAGKSMDQVTMFGTYELPWACRIDEFGAKVTLLGIKKEMELVVAPAPNGTKVDDIVEGLQDILQVKDIRLPKLLCEHDVSFLPLMMDGFWHGSIMYGEFKDWDGVTPYTEKPLFYQGVSDETGDLMVAISDEVMAVKAKLESLYPKLNLSYVVPTKDWFLSAYGDMIKDKSTMGSMLRTNSAYDGLTHPMREVDGGYVPDFKHRYMVEDLYMGIANIKSMAELAGIETPKTDEVIQWCEKCTGAELIVDGKFCGKDVKRTRTPQRYGFTDLDKFMKENRYV